MGDDNKLRQTDTRAFPPFAVAYTTTTAAALAMEEEM